jgi:hypothetical protein
VGNFTRFNDNAGIIEMSSTHATGGYAEMFETENGKEMQCGYFVTLVGRKIKIATKIEEYILGVTTAKPAILGYGNDVRWKNKYVVDSWGRIQYEEKTIPEVKDEQGNILIPAYTEKNPIINKEWDKTKRYIPRILRSEWTPVTLLGQVLVRDNGECIVDGYCACGSDGIAVPSENGYRVIERLGENQIIIILK